MLRRIAAYAWCVSLGAVRLTGRLAWNFASGRNVSSGQILGRTIADVFEGLGPTFVKLGQVLSTRRDLLGPEVAGQLLRLVDQLPPISVRELRAAWVREFGKDLEATFARLESVPVASASVASVFRAELFDGRTVAVKVQRPGITAIAEADFRLLRFGARCVELLPFLRGVPLRRAMEEIISCIRGQLDFGREAAISRDLRAALAWESDLIVPRTIDELCGEAIITMEFVDGLASRPRELAGAERAALRTALRGFYRMVFVEGLVHCDLHPGNLHLLPSGEAVVLDFGFTVELDDDDRLKFAEFFYAMATGDGRRCADIAVDMATELPRGFDIGSFSRDVTEIVEDAHDVRAGEFDVARFVASLFDVQRRHRLTSTTAFVMIAVALVVFEGLIKQVDPELDFQSAALPFIFRASLVGGARPPSVSPSSAHPQDACGNVEPQ